MPDISPKFRDAMKFAKEAHAGQRRKFADVPYVAHPANVAALVAKFKPGSKNLNVLLAAASLHDTVEDTETTIEQIRSKFGNFVAALVQELTSDKDKIDKLGKAEYLLQKMVSMSDYGLVLKLADRLSNTSDLPVATEKFREKYRTETKHILDGLERDRQLTPTQKKLVAAIKTKI